MRLSDFERLPNAAKEAILAGYFGPAFSPCPECVNGNHIHIGKCDFCACVEPLSVPVTVAARLELTGGQR